MQACGERDDVAICELVLVEFYVLLRNPQILKVPMSAEEAAATCQGYRNNPHWRLLEQAPVMRRVWPLAARADVARRRIFDLRLAFTLLHHGVTEFATANTKDFTDLGFSRVWDPTSSADQAKIQP
ncbi:TA system VapC family ribonuclease toxin [Thiorhodovibrio winogradskyi]|uniref:TA system VapC family ribonuclease toxin n=1 Tax=Thiorhodovibrio winogradskyi TaxID=77007 RepID=UPI0038B62664